MADILGTNKQKKIFKGAYEYKRDGLVYCDENFEVFKDTKELTTIYKANLTSRVSTGELLKITVEYVCNKDWVPIRVSINKTLGREFIEETFKLDSKANILNYQLKSKHSKEKSSITIPPRFHIQTPCAASSIVFLLSKKFDSTTKNLYSVYASENNWSFESPVVNKTVAMEKMGLGTEEIEINGSKVQAVKYRLIDEQKEDKNSKEKKDYKPASLTVYLSRHIAIPYRIEFDKTNKIEIKFLNNLQEGDEETQI